MVTSLPARGRKLGLASSTGVFVSAWAAAALVASCGLPRGAHAPSAVQDAWDGDGDPMNLNAGFNPNINQLPASARSKKTPWPDTYWPSYLGGIANRWQAPYNQNPQVNWSYTPPTKAELEAQPSLINALSPAEKYDIYMGRFDYPTVSYERTKRTSSQRPQWEGICHGWAPASKYFDEPKPFTATSKAGNLKIPFTSSDVKALLTYYQGIVSQAPAHNLGQRCDANGAFSGLWSKACSRKNTNPGAFHIVVTNTIGVRGDVLIGNLTRRGEIWNFPMFAYQTNLSGLQHVGRLGGGLRGFAPGTAYITFAQTTIWFVREVNPQAVPMVGTPYLQQATDSKTYQYRLELDGGGNIIGGKWLGDEIPGFLWDQDKPTFKENAYYGHISELYSQASGRALASPTFFTR